MVGAGTLRRRSPGEKLFACLNTIALACIAGLCLYPMFYVAMASVSEPVELGRHSGLIWKPLGFSLQAYRLVFENLRVRTGLLNSIFYVSAGTAINILMTSVAAYVLSRRRYRLKKLFTLLIIFTMYFGGGLIPFYLVVYRLGLVDTRAALLIPGAINTFYMIIMRTYFAGIPASLEESASIDGATDFSVLFRIILPLSLPVVAVMVVYYSVGHWNSWFSAMIFLIKSRELHPLQLVLREILIYNSTERMSSVGLSSVEIEQSKRLVKYALIIATVIPIALVYPFLQKHFAAGVMIGSLKE